MGELGEKIAVDYLQQKSYKIVTMNWHSSRGEIDIIARDADYWVFCEVKTRRNQTMANTFASITPQKREKLILTTQQYLNEHQLEDVYWRIDAIAIVIRPNQEPLINHVEDAFDW